MNREALQAFCCLFIVALVVLVVYVMMDTAVQKTVTYLDGASDQELFRQFSNQGEPGGVEIPYASQ